MEWPAYVEGQPWLPPGFRFHPTDEELVTCYLAKKVKNHSFAHPSIPHIDLNKWEPWELPRMAKLGEKEWYFYNLLDKKYPTGMRTNRATEAGYWKATGRDREVMRSKTNCVVGMKKTLVFYTGRAPKGQKTNWVMHEYRLHENSINFSNTSAKEELVICRVFQKIAGDTKICPDFRRNLQAEYTQPPPLAEELLNVTQPQFQALANYLPFTEPYVDHNETKPSLPAWTYSSSSYLHLNWSTASQSSNLDTPYEPYNSLDMDMALPSSHNIQPPQEFSQPRFSEGCFLLEELLQGYQEHISLMGNDYIQHPQQQLLLVNKLAPNFQLPQLDSEEETPPSNILSNTGGLIRLSSDLTNIEDVWGY